MRFKLVYSVNTVKIWHKIDGCLEITMMLKVYIVCERESMDTLCLINFKLG